MNDENRQAVDQLLLRTQQAVIARVLKAVGLPISNFSFEPDVTNARVHLIYKSEPQYSLFLNSLNVAGFRVTLQPGKDRPTEQSGPHTWDQLETVVRRWASFLKREVVEDDLWVLLSEPSPKGPSLHDIPNTAFSTEEIELLYKKIDEILEHLEGHKREAGEESDEQGSSLQLSSRQVELASRQVDLALKQFELHKEYAKVTGRRDWLHMFMRSLYDTCLARLLSEERVHSFMEWAWGLLEELFLSES